LLGAKEVSKSRKIHTIQFERHTGDMRDDRFTEIHNYLTGMGFVKVHEIRHPFGNIFELLYTLSL